MVQELSEKSRLSVRCRTEGATGTRCCNSSRYDGTGHRWLTANPSTPNPIPIQQEHTYFKQRPSIDLNPLDWPNMNCGGTCGVSSRTSCHISSKRASMSRGADRASTYDGKSDYNGANSRFWITPQSPAEVIDLWPARLNLVVPPAARNQHLVCFTAQA